MEKAINKKAEYFLDNMNENQLDLLVNSVTSEKVDSKN